MVMVAGKSVEGVVRPLSGLIRLSWFIVPVVTVMVASFFLSLAVLGRHDAWGVGLGILTSMNMGLLCASCWTGFLGLMAPHLHALHPTSGMAPARATGMSRTAVLMPVCNENPERVCMAIEVMHASMLQHCLGSGRMDIFILSDTSDPVAAAAEERAFKVLMARMPAGASGADVHYRRRTTHEGRKAGNVKDFLVRWGTAYDYSIVLDADSLVTGGAMASMVARMDSNPRVGMLQAMCYPVGKGTVFARILQFGARLGGPVLADGLAAWQGAEGSYWGHNAIFRTDAFMSCCGLPVLPGVAPLGGEILCHDVVEAAFMVRAGWDVRLDTEVDGSFEEIPTNLCDSLARERRWCQGNMQHTRLLGVPGMKAGSLMHLGLGISYYAAAPLLMLLLVATVLMPSAAMPSAAMPSAAMPPTGNGAAGSWLLGIVLTLLFLPRFISVCRLMPGQRAKAWGGRLRLIVSAFLSVLFGFLSGPVTMGFGMLFMASTLCGRTVRWDAQARDDRGIAWREAGRTLAPLLVAMSILPLAAAAYGHTAVAMLFLPGLILGVPLAVLCSRPGIARMVRRFGLFTTPYETMPCKEILHLQHLSEAPWATTALLCDMPSLPAETHGVMPAQSITRLRVAGHAVVGYPVASGQEQGALADITRMTGHAD